MIIRGRYNRPLIRRGADGTCAFYRCWSPTPTSRADLVRVAGVRWSIEEGFQAGKSQVGLAHYQVRGWAAWHRWITLAMLALAVLTTAAAAAAPPAPADPYQHARRATPR